jgi:hypothetical protein
MSKPKKTTIEVQGSAITILSQKEQDFICLTDMARKFGDDILIYSWMRNRSNSSTFGSRDGTLDRWRRTSRQRLVWARTIKASPL